MRESTACDMYMYMAKVNVILHSEKFSYRMGESIIPAIACTCTCTCSNVCIAVAALITCTVHSLYSVVMCVYCRSVGGCHGGYGGEAREWRG